ncbi:uncharacterized protein LOC103318031 [Nasonia vitripennis]|uniref:Protein translocase subunit SecA n=1 Tax=Nasonia vitripennis TaxID=7425 RepID=A0A7M7LSB4_NASVI|nr:uncharacterized protein LOC103318031 [Nasonia vitripennis]
MSQLLSEKITTETLRKIASNEEYDEKEILCVAEYLVELYEYDFERQFGLITTEDPSKSYAFDKLKDIDAKEEPFFIIYNKGVKHWVCLAITYLHNSVVVLYKDSFGVQIPHNLRDAIGDCLKSEKIRFDSHRGTEQSDASSSGPICLRNLQVLLKGLKSDFIKVPLIEKFQKVRFCTQYGVQNVKREFRLWLQKYLLSGLEEVATELVEDENYGDFKKILESFLETCSKVLKETYMLSSTYTSLLKSEAKKKDQDPRYEPDHKTIKALKDAKEKFYKNSEVQRSLKFNKDDFIDIEDGYRVYNLDIQERYPEQMQKFTKIFAVLAQAEMNEELEIALKKVSQMLGLDYEKIRVYFDQQKTARRLEFMRGDFTPPNVIAGLEKAVEVMKSKSKSVKDSVKVDSQDKKIKSWDLLLSELVLDAQIPNDDSTTADELEAQVKEIRESLPRIQQHYSSWSSQGIAEISMFANACKAEEKIFETDQIYEAIAVLDRANELATGGQRLRAPQILSVLVFLKSTASYHGKLCQIESGEGKTVIVSLLATMMILQGEKTVDVITSNAVLAQEGIESRKLFYALFGISVSTNAPDKTYAQGPRKCYLADVVYGSISDFQFDYLRDTAEGLGTLSGRQFGRVILDEVDNMLVDNGRHIAKISSPFPGMENLKYIYLRIWSELLNVEYELMEDFQEKLNGFSNLKSAKEMAITEFIKIFDASMIGRMEERIKANLKDLDLKFAPTHCLNYADIMVPKWIGNAIRARYFINENEQYSIKETNGEYAIIPVDYSNTGVTLKNTVWSYGLHQFVQIKHNLRITPESLTSSCVSNYAYIGKYGNKIFGLTGTLGSKAEQDLLSSIYNVDYARVPTYKTKVFKELKGVVVPDEEWSFEVALLTMGMIRSTGRAVLIICKTIADLLVLEEQFKSMEELPWDCKIQLKKFQDEETADVTRETVSPGDVIIATNIAGRGADFKTSKELEKNGGLHVCVGFCPDNERVREQAFFRTSRQGNAGSAQLVVRESEIKRLNIDTTNLNDIDFDEVKRRIDIIERERLSDIKYSKVDVLRYEDAVFSLFSDFCQELKNSNVITWGHSYLMKDLKEFWAFWLEDQNFEGKKYSLKEASFIFYKFKNHDKTRRIVDGSISQNPYYGVLQADFFLKNDEVEKAKASLINAICLSKKANVMFPAFLTLFDSTLEEKGPLLPRFRNFLAKVFASEVHNDERTASFVTEILEYLTISLAGLSEEITFMENHYFNDDDNDDFKRVLIKPAKGKENLLVKHLAAKLTCLKVYRGNVEILLEVLEGSDTHSICISKRITDYLKNFKPDTKEEKQTKDLITDAELTELGSKGLKTVYGLKKIAKVSDSELEKAKSQILGGLALIARATAFPPLTFAVANVVSCMVAEAIASVVLALFKETNNIDDILLKAEYLKGKSLNYIVSLMASGTLSYDVCIKVFLRMIRCYRESYYLLEHSSDNSRLLKSVNSTQISKDVKAVENYGEYGTAGWTKKIRVPEAMATYFFESEVGNTIIASLVDFIVDKQSNGPENANGVKDKTKPDKSSKKTSFFQPANNSQNISKIESYLSSVLPKRFGGAYEEVRNQFPNGEGFVVVNLVPSEICYKDTPYSAIPRSRIPAIVMLDRDYRGLQKLRFNAGNEIEIEKKKKKSSKEYCKMQQELLEKGEFWMALRNEVAEILAVSKFYELNVQDFVNYTMSIIQMLQYCKDESIPDVPNGHLINSEQYCNILKHFKLKHEAF